MVASARCALNCSHSCERDFWHCTHHARGPPRRERNAARGFSSLQQGQVLVTLAPWLAGHPAPCRTRRDRLDAARSPCRCRRFSLLRILPDERGGFCLRVAAALYQTQVYAQTRIVALCRPGVYTRRGSGKQTRLLERLLREGGRVWLARQLPTWFSHSFDVGLDALPIYGEFSVRTLRFKVAPANLLASSLAVRTSPVNCTHSNVQDAQPMRDVLDYGVYQCQPRTYAIFQIVSLLMAQHIVV